VLAAYMAGLAVGAVAIEPWLSRIRRPLLVYGACELGIGLSVLVVPLLITALGWLLVLTMGHRPEPPGDQGFGGSLFYVVGAFLTLGVPTALMGATLPVLSRYAVRADPQVGRRVGLLYAGNTAGAVLGALAGGFWLLPRLGLAATVWAGALINIGIFVVAIWLARGLAPVATPSAAPAPNAAPLTLARGPGWILPLMLFSGAVSFLYEVLWTRMLSHILGSSIFAFATMLASALTGIALGGGLAAAIARDRRISGRAFVLAQFAIAAASACVYGNLDRWVPQHGGIVHHPWLAMLLLLPGMLAIGATYPLAVRIYADDALAAAPAAARVYAWNTVGAVVGALLAGLVIVPTLRFEGATHLAVGASLALGVAALVLVVRARLPWIVTVVAIALGGVIFFQPAVPERLLLASPLAVGSDGDIRYYDVGRAASVVVLERDGMFALRTNGLPEALLEMSGTPPKFSGEWWLAPLAIIAAPRAASMLIVGLGGAVVVDGVPPSVHSIDVIELEPKVIAANRAMAVERKRDPLRDPRLHLIINDARSALALTDKRYDAIVSQPSHPWTAGASHLYTREFMQLAREHLAPQGVFVQWMNVAFLDAALLRSFVATLLDVFPQLEIYRPDPNTLVFVASAAPLDTVGRLARNSAPLWWSPAHYARFGILAAEDVVAALVAAHAGASELAQGAPLITDDRNRLATSSVYELGASLDAASAGRLLAPYDPMRRKDSWLTTDAARSFSMPYIARRLALYAPLDPTLIKRLEALAAGVADRPTALYVQAITRGAQGDSHGAAKLLAEAAALAPQDRQILFERVRPQFAAITAGNAAPDYMKLAAQLSGSAAAVVDAARFSAAGQWQKVAELDSTLALANPTDGWYFQALATRADWRSRISNPELRPVLGQECLNMVDQAIVSQPAIALFQLRTQCAASLGRADAVIESIFAYAVGTRASLATLSRQEIVALQPHFDALAQMAQGAGQLPTADSGRAQQVASLVLAVDEQLKARVTKGH
jgi:spermidine synthase